MYNSLYCVTEMQVPPEVLGKTMQIQMTIGQSATCLVSLIALLPQPYPQMILIALECLCLFCTLVLPRGGMYLPQTIKLTESITLMDFEHIEETMHDTVRMHSQMHSMTFN